jgi:hypothetical protein
MRVRARLFSYADPVEHMTLDEVQGDGRGSLLARCLIQLEAVHPGVERPRFSCQDGGRRRHRQRPADPAICRCSQQALKCPAQLK